MKEQEQATQQKKDGKKPNPSYTKGHSNRGDQSKRPGPKDINDWQWYALSETIGKSVGSIPYNVFPGTQEEVVELIGNSKVEDRSTRSTPGVLAIEYAIMPGISSDASSAVNIAARSTYSFVRHQNSGHANYESSDLMMYLLAMDEIYTAYLEACRIYRVAKTYALTNRNIPFVILRALGVDPDNIVANLAQFRYGLNVAAAKISAMAVPNIFHSFKRHALIATGIWTDSTSTKGQFYVYRRKYGHKFNFKTQGGGSLDPYTVVEARSSRTYMDILDEISSLCNEVLPDEDMNIMSGDILKAYGRENLYVLKEVDENETQEFIYDENILAQIENSFCVPTKQLDNGAGYEVTQKNNLIYSIGSPLNDLTVPPELNNSEQLVNNAIVCTALGNKYFNSHKDDPDWKDALEWSRNTMAVKEMVNPLNNEKHYYQVCGTEMIIDYIMYAMDYYTDEGAPIPNNVRAVKFTNVFNFTDFNDLSAFTDTSVFDWHPICYMIGAPEPNVVAYYGKFGDLKNYTLISNETKIRLHDAAVMSEFGPQLTIK